MIGAGQFTLRPWQAADAAFVFDACQDAEIQRWTTVPRPFTAGDAATFVRAHARDQPEEAGAWFAVSSTDTGELFGSMSFNTIDRRGAYGEIGYWLAPEGRGRGAATACLVALTGWGFASLGLTEVRLQVAAGNVASLRVAEVAGFSQVGAVAAGCQDGDRPADALVFVRRAAGSATLG